MKYFLLLATILSTTFASHAQDWAELHNLLIKFYGYQRAGLKDADPHNPFYTRSPYPHANDGSSSQPLDGGWYDAGDYVKFGLPLGWSVYCMLKGYDVFPRGYDDKTAWTYEGGADTIADVLGEAKFATDYLIKAVVSDDKVVRDVGDAHQDHQQWVDGYNSTAARTVYARTGADVAGLYAASLALMSILYKDHDATYAATCLDKAKQAFSYATKNQNASQAQLDPQSGNQPFYETETWKDKMACGAIELYRATDTEMYMDWAKQLMADVGSHYYVMGYANAGDLAAFELYRQGETGYISSWISDVNLAISRVVTESSASHLIKGAFINSDWGVCRDAANAAFSAALAFMIKGDEQYKNFAMQQIKWVAGLSPFSKSYIVGYNGGPRNPHHRNSSVLGIQIEGGIVSGPAPQSAFDPSKPENAGWSFTDSKDIYQNTEVAIDYNAGAISAIAFIRDYLDPPPGLVRIATGLKAGPDPVDLNDGVVEISGALENTQRWKIALTGRNSGAKKTYSGNSAAISLQWSGQSDQGAFQTDEYVDVVLDMEGIAEYHAARARTSFFIAAMKKEPPRASDVLIDNFNDTNLTAIPGGRWSTFSDKEIGGSSYTFPSSLGSSAFTANGENDTYGLISRLIGKPGVDHPYAGVRLEFSDGAPIGIGRVTSIMFDARTPSDSGTFRVELLGQGIEKGACHGAEVKLSSNKWHRVRIPISSFSQPDWKTSGADLDGAKIIALRFTYYGESNLQLILDNIYMENFSLGSPVRIASAFSGKARNIHKLTMSGGTLSYVLYTGAAAGDIAARIYSCDGREIAARHITASRTSSMVEFSGSPHSPGVYFLRHHVNGKPFLDALRIVVP